MHHLRRSASRCYSGIDIGDTRVEWPTIVTMKIDIDLALQENIKSLYKVVLFQPPQEVNMITIRSSRSDDENYSTYRGVCHLRSEVIITIGAFVDLVVRFIQQYEREYPGRMSNFRRTTTVHLMAVARPIARDHEIYKT